MHLSRSIIPPVIACLVFIAGCQKNEQAVPVAQPEPAAKVAADASAGSNLHGWAGTWFGPEGMSLQIVARPDARYDVIIDGERTFIGTGGSGHIYFERDGVQEKIQATDGEATGMKWLADKSTCLTIKEGEGYCRD